MPDLADFGVGQVRPPLLRRKRIVRTPIEEKIAGFTCRELRRDTNPVVYSTLRTRKHFYREGDGWAISDKILAHLENVGVSRIFVHEGTKPTDDVYEYRASDYYQSEKHVHEKDLEDERDPQTYVKKDEYMHEWPDHAADLFDRSFEDALDRINERKW